MHKSLDHTLSRFAALAVTVVLLLVPFHAFLTVWLSQSVGHYTLLRLWKEVLLVLTGCIVIYLISKLPEVRRHLQLEKLWWLIAAYVGIQVIWGVVALLNHQVAARALGYGWIVDTRFLVFLVIVRVVAARVPLRKWWPGFVFPSAALVVMFGLAQYFLLPYDFLRRVGYSATTIFPYEDINSNVHYIRVMSTLRGANPLGAYLLVILTLLTVMIAIRWRQQSGSRSHVVLMVGGFAAGLVVFILTFSRGAWAGLMASAAILVGAYTPRRLRSRATAAAAVVVVIILMSGIGVALRHNTAFQNVFLHTQENSTIASTSNAGHASALQSAAGDVVHEPLGRGPGTAGPASVYNAGHDTRIAENYYLQVAQETGWLGFGLFVGITAMVAYQLWLRRGDPLALGLLASLGGLLVVNLLSHAWADDTLAYFWWGLAGLALASPPPLHLDQEVRSVLA